MLKKLLLLSVVLLSFAGVAFAAAPPPLRAVGYTVPVTHPDEIDLSWKANSMDYIGFNVYLDGVKQAPNPANSYGVTVEKPSYYTLDYAYIIPNNTAGTHVVKVTVVNAQLEESTPVIRNIITH